MKWTIEPTTEPTVAHLKRAYRERLAAPLDGMWDTGLIPRAGHWAILVDGALQGYFCLDDDERLLQFDLVDAVRHLGGAIMADLVDRGQVRSALAGTNEPYYLGLCLDRQQGVAVHTYLYHDHRPVAPSLPAFGSPPLRPAQLAEMETLVDFAVANIGGPVRWLRPYLTGLVNEGALFVVETETETETAIIGWGECRWSETQPAYADVGLAVAKAYRRRGLGTYILARLKEICYERGRRPICSTTVENIGSQKAIAGAGFICAHRLLEITFQAGADEEEHDA